MDDIDHQLQLREFKQRIAVIILIGSIDADNFETVVRKNIKIIINRFAGRVYTTIRYCFLDIAQFDGMVFIGIFAQIVHDVQDAQLAVDGFLDVVPASVHENTSLR